MTMPGCGIIHQFCVRGLGEGCEGTRKHQTFKWFTGSVIKMLTTIPPFQVMLTAIPPFQAMDKVCSASVK